MGESLGKSGRKKYCCAVCSSVGILPLGGMLRTSSSLFLKKNKIIVIDA